MATKKYEKQEVTGAYAIRLLEKVVLEKGAHYRYLDNFSACRNFEYPGGPPACIVGHVFHKLGLTYEECGNFSVAASVKLIKDRTKGAITFTQQAILLLRTAQTIQDNGGTWGLALGTAQALYHMTHRDKEYLNSRDERDERDERQ